MGCVCIERAMDMTLLTRYSKTEALRVLLRHAPHINGLASGPENNHWS